MTDKNEVQVIESKDVAQVNNFITQAIKKNLPIETMEKLFALMERAKESFAKSEYHRAMSKFQSECPVIEKTKVVLDKNNKPRYSYAPIEAIVEQTKKPLGDAGLSYTFTTGNKEGFIVAIVKITHFLGFSETSDFEIPIDKDSFMSKQQQYAAALTYAKRYALCNALGISTGDEDTDRKDDEQGAKPVDVAVCKERIERALNVDQLRQIWKDELTADERNSNEVKEVYVAHLKTIKSAEKTDAGK